MASGRRVFMVAIVAVVAVACGPLYETIRTGLPWSQQAGVLDNGEVVLGVAESANGTDRNGDGDADDVVAVVQRPDGTVISLALAIEAVGVVPGGYAILEVDEGAQGSTDLNGDGVISGGVLHLYDGAAGTVSVLGPVGRFHVATGSGEAVVGVEESSGDVDLNGDGDVLDLSAHQWSVGGGFSNLGVALRHPGPKVPVVLANGDVLLAVTEWGQGMSDLNGDGDHVDDVWHHVEPDGTVGVLAHFTSVRATPDASAVDALFSEAILGTDLDGDGALTSDVFHRWNPGDGTAANSGFRRLPSSHFGDGTVGLHIGEFEVEVDLNSDGDEDDEVAQVWDPATGIVTNLGLAGAPMNAGDGFAAVAVDECQQGEQDLNGNGLHEFEQDQGQWICNGERVVQTVDLRTSVVTNLGLGLSINPGFDGPVEISTGGVGFVVSETKAGIDLTGDGYIDRRVWFEWNPEQGVRNWLLGVEAGHLRATEQGTVVLTLSEGGSSPVAYDLNDDGDTEDSILGIWSPESGFRNTEIGDHDPRTRRISPDGTVVFRTEETDTDLNGDGEINVFDDPVWSIARPMPEP